VKNGAITDRPKVLVIEDDESIRTQMKWALLEGYDVFLARDGVTAMTLLKKEEPSLVTLDLGLPPNPEGTEEGLKLLGQILAQNPMVKVVVVTGNPDRAAALEAISRGALDFFTKPIDIDELKTILKRAAYVHNLEVEYHLLQKQLKTAAEDEVVCSCKKMQKILSTVRKVATTDVPVLITGESGTGKEVIAHAVHTHSLRKKGPFIAINCGAIPENLMESELFGHEKGVFTGAHTQRKGRIELAQGGTLLLDEIGDLPLSLQVKLLRFLQNHTIERVGGRETIEVDVRILAATNRNVQDLIGSGEFREDLYYRLAVVSIELPPLRERGEDMLHLAKHMLKKYTPVNDVTKTLTMEAVEAIYDYNWPGNVRELENKIRRAIAFSENSSITPEDIGLNYKKKDSENFNLKEAREDLEASLISKAILKVDGNVSKAAEILGISRPSLHGFIKKYNISK